jgi:RNA polymerase sigma-70 factor (ECF subfamily)
VTTLISLCPSATWISEDNARYDTLISFTWRDKKERTLATAVTTDEELMVAYRDGDVQAFDILFARHRDGLFRYLSRQSGNQNLAEEIFQEAWASVIKHRANYTVRARFKTYLFHIAHNKLIDYYRRNSRIDAISYEDEAPQMHEPIISDDNPEHSADTQRKVLRLLKLLERLPAAQREVFIMHEETGMSLSEIAHTLEVSRDTVKSRLRYALERLRRGMGQLADT